MRKMKMEFSFLAYCEQIGFPTENIYKLVNCVTDPVFEMYYHIIGRKRDTERFPLETCISRLTPTGIDFFIEAAQWAERNDITLLLIERMHELNPPEEDRFAL